MPRPPLEQSSGGTLATGPDVPRRAVLRLGAVAGAGGLGVVLAGSLTGCSAAQREALLDVDPRDVRWGDGGSPEAEPPQPGPSERELRRRRVRAGSVLAAATLGATPVAVPGPFGGAADPAAVLAVHVAHVDLLGPAADRPGPAELFLGRSPGEVPAGGAAADAAGPVLPPERRPAVVLAAGATVALGAAVAERGADDADVDLAVLYARVAAARAAQAQGLRGAGPGTAWPTTAAPAVVVDALQDLLAQEHRARWSYAVVQAWSTTRREDAAAARAAHTERVETLDALLARLGAEPVAALPTYPTDLDGQPVDGPASAAALALRLEDAVAAATAVVLAAAVAEAPAADWTAAGVTALATAERCRFSWGGSPEALPGG